MSSDRLNERIELLSVNDPFEALSPEDIRWLAQRTPERDYESGEIVYIPGDASEVAFVLLAGGVRLYGMVRGQELTFAVVRAGTIFGEVSLAERTHDEYAEALEPSRVALVSLHDFWHLAKRNPEVTARVVGLMGDRLRQNRGRMVDIALKEVPARLAGLIVDLVQSEGVVTGEGHYRILTRYTHEQLATMIGAKRVAVTRAFGTLRDAGCVKLLRHRIYVSDLAALSRLAVTG
jgi:CRP/FNR family transcriptional regulator, cyclic AMP receptor protein